MGEDELIQTFFAPLTAGFAGAFGLRDDAAVLMPPPGEDLVLTSDAVAEGLHFFADDAPADIAWKALAVNVSDLIAKGARPLTYLLSLALPDTPRRPWLEGFAGGLGEAQTAFSIHLAGGDTDRRPGPLTVTITAIGAVPRGGLVRRATARAGDILYVSGAIGDSTLGLRLRCGAMTARDLGLDASAEAALVARYLRPQPRVDLAPVLRAFASAAMDVSDGLVKDCGRLARASGLAAEIVGPAVPLSEAARAVVQARSELYEAALGGGDDYEVLATIPAQRTDDFEAAAASAGVAVTRIGRMVPGNGVVVTGKDGRPLTIKAPGWDHFPG